MTEIKYPISAVVPTLNEESALPRTLQRLQDCGFEIVVVDGGSQDRTVDIARDYTATVLSCRPGRARQMNLGAARAHGRILFFVHADSLPPLNARDIIIRTLQRPKVAAGAFLLKIDSSSLLLKGIAAMANLRAWCARLPYGDQGLFLYRQMFESIGGFSSLLLMEDVDLVRRLKVRGRVVLARGTMLTSARRWEQGNALGHSVRNVRRLYRFYHGAPPDHLAADYPDVR